MHCPHSELDVVCDGYYIRVSVCRACGLRLEHNREDPAHPWFLVGLVTTDDQRAATMQISQRNQRRRELRWMSKAAQL